MDSYYSGDHIAGDRIHKDITTYKIEEPQQKFRLGTVSNRLRDVGRAGDAYDGVVLRKLVLKLATSFVAEFYDVLWKSVL